MRPIAVTGSFDDFRSRHVRLLQEAARLGLVHVALWNDAVVRNLTGAAPKFPCEEREYVLSAVRHVSHVSVTGAVAADELPALGGILPAVWALFDGEDNPRKRAFCETHGLALRTFGERDLRGFPEDAPAALHAGESGRKRVVVTGCYDWFHSGHVRFFEEAAALGELYIVVGSDANVRLLKGAGHPFFPQEERRYMVQSIRYVAGALISSGEGWMDAAPEIARIAPHVYAVNRDGDRPEKREFCRAHGLEYVVLERAPKEGLPARTSTDLRGY